MTAGAQSSPGEPQNHPGACAIIVLPLSFAKKFPADKIRWTSRAEVARESKNKIVAEFLAKNRLELNLLDQRDLVTALVNGLMSGVTPATPTAARPMLAPSPQIKTRIFRCNGKGQCWIGSFV